MQTRKTILLTLTIAALTTPNSPAQTKPTELPNAKDSPLISRYKGSVLQNTATESFASIRIPAGPGHAGSDGKLLFDKVTPVEGHIDAYFYIQPKDRTALEVFRNYQSALSQAGFTPLFTCEMRTCDQARIPDLFPAESVRTRKWSSRNDVNPASSIDRDIRFLSAKTKRNGVDTFVMVFVAEPDSIWQAPVCVLLVAEPAAMETGNVTITSEQLQKGLAEEGRVLLYEIFFDTGSAALKPESKRQLDEMARFLASNRSLKVAIVGHTDNQGAITTNVSLSQRRAEAVVATLISNYKIDPARLQAHGVASFAPIATNHTEAGRSKNRRVELIEQ